MNCGNEMKNDLRSCERNLSNCLKKPEKIQGFKGVWTRDLAIPMRDSNQLSYEATDVGRWSIVGKYFFYSMNGLRTTKK